MKTQIKVDTSKLEEWIQQGVIAQASSAFKNEIEGELDYMTSLEDGWSKQAIHGMVEKFMDVYGRIISKHVTDVFSANKKSKNIVSDISEGLSLGALEVTRIIAWRTPVDTGRAQGSWLVRLCNPTSKKVLARVYAIQAIVSTGGKYRIYEEVTKEQQAGLKRTGAGQEARNARAKLLKAQGRRG